MVNDDELVWKALADPTRRTILDLLRVQPYTTGSLASQFSMSRIGVMKHLKILEQANLVLDKKEGREHWYRLNVIPLEEMYNRWMRPYEKIWAQSLINLKQSIESEQQMEKTTSFDIVQHIQIKASPEKVFSSLTQNISNWWGRPYIINESSTSLTLEPKLGGLFYESWGEGQGYKWGEVTYFKNNEILEITGPFGMQKAYFSKVCFTLKPKDSETEIELSHQAFGELDEETKKGYSGGWQELIGVRLKKFVEEGVKMGLGNEPPMEST